MGITNWQCPSELLSYHTSQSGEDFSPMKETQKSIYYITGESKGQVANSAFMEPVWWWSFQVVLTAENINEYWVQQLKGFDGKSFVSFTKESPEVLEDEEKKMEESKVKLENLCKLMKEILDKEVSKVTISNRLCLHPAALWLATTNEQLHGVHHESPSTLG